MTPEQWLGLATVCTLGAMSPGPSLAFVMRNTMAGGRRVGLITAIGHGMGIGLYAFAFVALLAGLLAAMPSLESGLRWIGIALLIAFGSLLMRSSFSTKTESIVSEPDVMERNPFTAGFAIAFFNPKIAAWMVAVYSQFVEVDSSLLTMAGMGGLAFAIDATWYAVVAVLLSGTLATSLQNHAQTVDRIVGALLILSGILLIIL
ncbi:MAG TPA: LysE family translocator [Candidatus Poseidoniales archaeon]|nr:MAG TPA: LysE family translocator [Candidatus Poseidoniales archaeon]|tara:strand:+ start:652 stop:1263 length:612 start_codon:yes stop_codon:yes gene_type:complete